MMQNIIYYLLFIIIILYIILKEVGQVPSQLYNYGNNRKKHCVIKHLRVHGTATRDGQKFEA